MSTKETGTTSEEANYSHSFRGRGHSFRGRRGRGRSIYQPPQSQSVKQRCHRKEMLQLWEARTLRTIVGDQENGKKQRVEEAHSGDVPNPNPNPPHILLLQEYSLLIQEHLAQCGKT
jgi:hypothetical protein